MTEQINKELFEIALRAIEKNYSLSELRDGDDLYNKSRENKQKCEDYYETIQEQGVQWAYDTLEDKSQPLTLNQYQQQAMTTCMNSSKNFSYMMLNLVGEVGEFASKVAKGIRKENLNIIDNELIAYNGVNEQTKLDLKKEAGDILWQLSGLCEVMGWSLEEVAQINLDKLASRQKRDVIDGNGDNR